MNTPTASRLSALLLAVVLLLSVFLLPGCANTDDAQNASSPTGVTQSAADSGGTASAVPSRKMVEALMDEWGKRLNAQYGASLPDTYAGAYNDTTALVICVTDDAAAEALRSLLPDETVRSIEATWLSESGEKAADWADHNWVHFATVKHSLNALQALKEKMDQNKTEWKIASATIDVANNRLDVALDGSDATKETIQAALSSAELDRIRFSIYAPAG